MPLLLAVQAAVGAKVTAVGPNNVPPGPTGLGEAGRQLLAQLGAASKPLKHSAEPAEDMSESGSVLSGRRSPLPWSEAESIERLHSEYEPASEHSVSTEATEDDNDSLSSVESIEDDTPLDQIVSIMASLDKKLAKVDKELDAEDRRFEELSRQVQEEVKRVLRDARRWVSHLFAVAVLSAPFKSPTSWMSHHVFSISNACTYI